MSEIDAMMGQIMQLMMGGELKKSAELLHLHFPRRTQVLVHCKGCDEMVFDVHDPSDLCEWCCYCNDGEGAACTTYIESMIP